MADPDVSADTYRLTLRKLLVAWKMHSERGVEVDRQRVGTLALVYPWVAQTHRFGLAYLQLEKAGFSHEGHVVVRSALEHALMAHWVAVTGDEAVVSRYAEDHRLLEQLAQEAAGRPRDLAQSRWDLDLLRELVAARQPAGADEARVTHKIRQVCDRLGLLNTLYPAYRVHSWFAHPTTHTADAYLEDMGQGRFALRSRPKEAGPDATVSMMAHCVYWARRVLDDLTTGRPNEEWLDELAAGMQVTPRLPDPQP